jgi:hypothetical protein
MIEPENIEQAESNDYFEHTEVMEPGISVDPTDHREIPRVYTIIQEFSSYFELSNGELKPTQNVIFHTKISDAHTKQSPKGPAYDKSYDVNLSVSVSGSLCIEDGSVIDGDMEVIYEYYI